MVLIAIVALLTISWAYMPKVAFSWSQRMRPWHASPWQRADEVRTGLLAAQTILDKIVWPAERAVRWARILVVRVDRQQNAPASAGSVLAVAAVVTTVAWVIFGHLVVSGIIGLVVAAVARKAGTTAVVHRPDGEEVNTGMVFDFRPALAILAIAFAIWALLRI